MWKRMALALCLALLTVGTAGARAQIIAGSAEDKAFQAISATEGDKKVQLLLDFEKQFPQSKILSDVYLLLMEAYRAKNDNAKVNEFGEKCLKVDPNNVTALMAVARGYGMERKNLPQAVQYAQRAVDSVAKMKDQPPPPQFSEDQWKQYLESTDAAAKGILNWVKSIRP